MSAFLITSTFPADVPNRRSLRTGQLSIKRYGSPSFNTYTPHRYPMPSYNYPSPYKFKTKGGYSALKHKAHQQHGLPDYVIGYLPSYFVPPLRDPYLKPYGSSYFPPYQAALPYSSPVSNAASLTTSYGNSYGSPSYASSTESSYGSSYGRESSFGSHSGPYGLSHGRDYGSGHGTTYNHGYQQSPTIITNGGFDHYQGPFYYGGWIPTFGPYKGPSTSPSYGLVSDSF